MKQLMLVCLLAMSAAAFAQTSTAENAAARTPNRGAS